MNKGQNITYERVTAKNVGVAVDLLSLVFPDERDDVRAVFDAVVAPLEERQKIPECADLSRMDYFIMKADGQPIGVSGIYSYKGQEDEAWIGWLGISPAARGKGYGKELLNHIEETARDVGCHTLRLWTTDSSLVKRAGEVYTKAGFNTQELPGHPPLLVKNYPPLKCLIRSKKIAGTPTRPEPWDGWREKGLAGSGLSPEIYRNISQQWRLK